MKIASSAGVLGEKIKVDSTYNSLVNEQGDHDHTDLKIYPIANHTGLANTNVEGDLKVEHQNLELKLGLLNLAGNVMSHIP